jgi:hypothetical protein
MFLNAHNVMLNEVKHLSEKPCRAERSEAPLRWMLFSSAFDEILPCGQNDSALSRESM